jgi:hypothetical protein
MSPDRYVWVASFKNNRIYQNDGGFAFSKFTTRVIVTQVPLKDRISGLAIHSIINEKRSNK